MKSLKLIATLSFFFLTINCTTKPVETPTETPQTAIGDVPGFKSEWTSRIVSKSKGGLLTKFNAAQDDMAKRFCPNYKQMNEDGQSMVWAYLMSAMVSYESGPESPKSGQYYKTNVVYMESNGDASEGLFQLTYGNSYCPTSKSKGDLHDPLVNIDCAIQLMASYASKDGVIASGGYTQYGAPAAKGLARYWAVIRVPDTKSKHHLNDIIAKTKQAPGCQ